MTIKIKPVDGRKRKMPAKGTPNGRIIMTEIRNGREWSFHVTKGWRSCRMEGQSS